MMIIFAELCEGNVHLFLSQYGYEIEPLVAYADGICLDPQTPPLSRYSRLLMETSIVGAVVLEENWIFLGWKDQQEIWLGLVSTWMTGHIKMTLVSPQQLREMHTHGKVISQVPNQDKLARSRVLLFPGTKMRAPAWLDKVVASLDLP